MILTSSDIQDGGLIPVKFTCDGEDVSPGLAWSDIPADTESLAIVCDDPDSPVGTWIHWVLFNIPGEVAHLEGGIQPVEKLDNGAIHGINDFRTLGYGGPCPPNGSHRYFYRLYALDTFLDLKPGCSKADLMEAMKGRILAQVSLMGKYGR